MIERSVKVLLCMVVTAVTLACSAEPPPSSGAQSGDKQAAATSNTDAAKALAEALAAPTPPRSPRASAESQQTETSVPSAGKATASGQRRVGAVWTDFGLWSVSAIGGLGLQRCPASNGGFATAEDLINKACTTSPTNNGCALEDIVDCPDDASKECKQLLKCQ
jgi:hypothetical protein